MGEAVGFGELKQPSPNGGGAAVCLWTECRRKRNGPIVKVIAVVVVLYVCFIYTYIYIYIYIKRER